MKRHGRLWEQVIDWPNLQVSFDRAKRGKTWQRTVQRAEIDRHEILLDVQRQLREQTFTTSAYRHKKVYEPKERDIWILPFAPDRIVQHAVVSVCAPLWDATFDPGSFACRPGRGQHMASTRCMQAVRRYPWVMQADVRKFYPSIPHDRLLEVVARKIKDRRVLWLLEDIVRSFPGDRNLPIGNLTSQWLGAVYLDLLDRFVRHVLGCADYLRYSDDFLIFARTKDEARRAQDACRAFLADRLDLTMAKDRVYPSAQGVDFVGYRHFPAGYKLVRKSTAKRMQRRVREVRYLMATGRMDPDTARSVVASIRGWLRWANAHHLAEALRLPEMEQEIHAALP